LLVRTRRSGVHGNIVDFSREIHGSLTIDRSRGNIEPTGPTEDHLEMYQTGKFSIVEVLEDESPLPEEKAIIKKTTKLPGINKSRKSGMFS